MYTIKCKKNVIYTTEICHIILHWDGVCWRVQNRISQHDRAAAYNYHVVDAN